MSPLRLEKLAPDKNQFRFYRLDLQPTLFGEWSVVREWGRIGRQGRVVIESYEHIKEAQQAITRTVHAKNRRGYKITTPYK